MGEMSKLKPCPFCGGRAEIDVRKTDLGKHITSVYCDMCLARTMQEVVSESGLDKFVKRTWNTRPIEEALLARAEKAEAMVERLIDLISYVIDDMPAYNADEWQTLVDEWNQSKQAEAE